MDAIQDFEDMLAVMDKHQVRYLIIGGLAFIYHAKPRYTKDMDLWLDPAEQNVSRANQALEEFGSATLRAPDELTQVVRIGLAPNRIDLLVDVGDSDFDAAWEKRIAGRYGEAPANWIDLDTLIEIKSAIDDPRHQEDARELKEVRRQR